jgi:hypothetical protein
MDGGNGGNTGIFLSDIESRIKTQGKEFLNRVDLFAGTSAGGVNALFFAHNTDPTVALEGIFRFDEQIIQSAIFGENPWNLFNAFAGTGSILSTGKMRDFYCDYFGATTTLAQLKHPVLLTSFQLDNGLQGRARSWVPKMFSNLPGDPTASELVVDVACRSSALPIVYPIFQSMAGTGPAYVDGALIANNPSMIALARCLTDLDLSDINMMSIGNGKNVLGKSMYLDPPLDNGICSWGYRQWLMDPTNPLLLMDMFLQSSDEAVVYQCRQLLKERFWRVNPPLVHGQVPNDPETQQICTEAAAWLIKSGWAAPAVAPEAPPTTPAPQPAPKSKASAAK